MMPTVTAAAGNGPLTVPPGFRFHPTDEELLYYYLRKKVSYEAIDLDVIREVDLNKLEPWDLKDKCRIGSGPQNEWYFFSHKDKKYPTGTRTNRATAAGFWKATGRDKAIHLLSNSKRIGMRKTLVFYTGRAPHGQKTDWIMHEYRLNDQDSNPAAAATPSEVQEDGWVVCRVFKKKNHNRSPFQADNHRQDHFLQAEDHHHHQFAHHDMNLLGSSSGGQTLQLQTPYGYECNSDATLFDGSMHLPQLLTCPHNHSPPALHPPFLAPDDQCSHLVSNNNNNNDDNNNNNNNNESTMMINDMECSRNLLSLMSTSGGSCGRSNGQLIHHPQDKPLLAASNMAADWSFLDKLLASHHHQPGTALDLEHHHHQGKCNDPSSSQPFHPPDVGPPSHRFPFHYLGYDTDILKFSK